MEGPQGIRLADSVGATDRGTLWRATRENEHDRIVRIVEPRFCDGRFRQALTGLRQRRDDRMLEITGEGWSGGNYHAEYAVPSPWLTLEERLAELPDWRDRGALLDQVCEVLPRWQASPVQPLGLNLRNIVVLEDAGRWDPWLVPCPAMTVGTPCDLFGLDTEIVAALAPEAVRGVQLDGRVQDAYALGTLVAQALGCPPARLAADDDEHRVEAQARGALLRSSPEGSGIPGYLHQVPQVLELFRTVRRYRHTEPDARPNDAAVLHAALAEATDPIALAGSLRTTDPTRALQVLSWVDDENTERAALAAGLAAEINAEQGDRDAALRLLDKAVALAPERMDLRRRRTEAAWRVFEPLPPGTEAGRIGDQLVKDLKLLRRLREIGGPTPHLRVAEVHRRRGDLAAAADELHAAVLADPADLSALLAYALCWVDLGDAATTRQTVAEAYRRIDRMEQSQMLTTREAHQWRKRFAISSP